MIVLAPAQLHTASATSLPGFIAHAVLRSGVSRLIWRSPAAVVVTLALFAVLWLIWRPRRGRR